MKELPAFNALPLSAHLGLRCAWGQYERAGGDERMGTLNFIDRFDVAAALVQEPRTQISLSLPVDAFDPGLFWRHPPTHVIEQVDRNTFDDRLEGFHLQSSTHWDGLLHISAGVDGFYGGISADDVTAGERLGVHNWSGGVIGRGVLIDVTEALRQSGGAQSSDGEIDVNMLREAMERQGTTLPPGSVLCVRTGWIETFQLASQQERSRLASTGSFPGLRADEQMAAFLWDSRVAAVAADNPAVEVAPGDPSTGSLHRRSLAMTGLPFGELFDFTELAAQARKRDQWQFLFVSVPLHVRGGTGAPANAIAIM